MSWAKRFFIWLSTLFVCFIILWPVYWIIKSSFTESTKLYTVPIEYLPINLTLNSYKVLFNASHVSDYITHTLIITAVVLLLSTFLCALAGYAFARAKTRGIGFAFVFILFSTMVPGTVTVLPLMVMWRSLGLTDTFHGISVLYFSAVIPFSTIMYNSFTKQIPESLEEAALIDGTTVIGAFSKIIFPLLRPIMATLYIINFITCVNEFFIPLMFTTKKIKVMSTLMFNIPRVNEYRVPWDTISAAGCLMLFPSILFILFFEKNIMEGLSMGSLKQ